MKTKTITKTITKLIILLLTVALVMAACSNNDEMPLIRSQELSGEVTIALNYDPSSTNSQSSTLPYEPKADYAYMPIHNRILQFIEKHPKVNVNIINATWRTIWYFTDLIDSPPDFTIMPDIIELTPHQVRWMAKDGEMEELSFYIENMLDGLDWGQEYKTLIEKVSVDGKTYLLPVSSDPMIAFYNAPIFERLGVSPPSEGWTWDDFLNLASRLKEQSYPTGVLGIDREGSVRIDHIEAIIASLGGQFMSRENAIFEGYMNSTQTEQALELYVKHFIPLIEGNMLWSSGQNRLDTHFPALGIGRASDTYRILDQIDPLEKLDPVNRGYELAPMPSSASGERVNTSVVTGLAMTNVARDKELAWELMRFIVGEDDEHPMHLVTVTPLMVAERRFHRRPPEKLSELIQFIRAETNEAAVSSFAMVPTYLTSNVYDDGPFQSNFEPWYPNFDTDLSDAELTNEVRSYLNALLISLEDMRDEIIDKGFVFPQRDD